MSHLTIVDEQHVRLKNREQKRITNHTSGQKKGNFGISSLSITRTIFVLRVTNLSRPEFESGDLVSRKEDKGVKVVQFRRSRISTRVSTLMTTHVA